MVTRSVEWKNEHIVLTALIGLQSSKTKNEWQWEDQSVVDYTNWNVGEPNGRFNNEFCVETIVSGKSHLNTLNDGTKNKVYA